MGRSTWDALRFTYISVADLGRASIRSGTYRGREIDAVAHACTTTVRRCKGRDMGRATWDALHDDWDVLLGDALHFDVHSSY